MTQLTRHQAALEFLRTITQDESSTSQLVNSPIEESLKEISPIQATLSKLPARPSIAATLTVTRKTTLEFTTTRGSPVIMLSIIPHLKETKDIRKETKRQKKIYSMTPYLEKMGLTILSMTPYLERMDVVKRKKQAESFAYLLEPRRTLDPPPETTYNPIYLDDPELKAIGHKTIITLPCFLV